MMEGVGPWPVFLQKGEGQGQEGRQKENTKEDVQFPSFEVNKFCNPTEAKMRVRC